MVWYNPFKGGKYDISKTILSALPGGDPAGIYTHNNQVASSPLWQQLGYNDEDQWRLENGLKTSDGRMDPGLARNAQGLSGDGTPLYPSTSSGDGTGSGGNSSSVQNYLDLIGKKYGMLKDSFTRGIDEIQGNFMGESARARGNLKNQLGQIDDAIDQYGRTTQKNISNINNNAGNAMFNTETGLRAGFSARNALDSSFFKRALQQGVGDISAQQNQELDYVNSEFEKAKKTATQQKQSLENEYTDLIDTITEKKDKALQDLEDQYNSGKIGLQEMQIQLDKDPTEFASPSELKKLTRLNAEAFSIDSYLNDLENSARASIQKIRDKNNEVVDTSINMNNINQLLQNINQGLQSGMDKTDFVPILTSKGYSPEEIQSILNRAENFSQQLAMA